MTPRAPAAVLHPRPHRRDPPHRARVAGLRRAARRAIRAERDRLLAELWKHPEWKPWPSASNFILVRTPDAQAAHARLLAAGILVRRQDHYPGLEGCIRLSVGTRAENDALLAAAFGR